MTLRSDQLKLWRTLCAYAAPNGGLKISVMVVISRRSMREDPLHIAYSPIKRT
jgi:hypothetical protein